MASKSQVVRWAIVALALAYVSHLTYSYRAKTKVDDMKQPPGDLRSVQGINAQGIISPLAAIQRHIHAKAGGKELATVLPVPALPVHDLWNDMLDGSSETSQGNGSLPSFLQSAVSAAPFPNKGKCCSLPDEGLELTDECASEMLIPIQPCPCCLDCSIPNERTSRYPHCNKGRKKEGIDCGPCHGTPSWDPPTVRRIQAAKLAQRQAAEAEATRIQAEAAEAEAARKAEAARIKEEKRQAAEAAAARKAEAERIKEEKRQAAEAEAARKAEAARIKEEKRQAAEAEAARIKEEKRLAAEAEAEKQRLADEKKAVEAEKQRLADEKKAEEEKQAALAAERQAAEAEPPPPMSAKPRKKARCPAMCKGGCSKAKNLGCWQANCAKNPACKAA